MFGAYDIDVQDNLTLMVSQLDHGNITVSRQQLIPPDVGPCSHDPLVSFLTFK